MREDQGKGLGGVWVSEARSPARVVHSCQEKVPNKKVLEIVFLFSLTSAPGSSHSPSVFTGQSSHDHRVQPGGGRRVDVL